MQKQVKIINVTAERFGIFKALELDLDKFKQGVIAFKGNAGQGKSTAQNAIKMGTQGRATLADASQYGEDWTTETQLLDGERRIYIGGSIKNGTIEYKLYEKDENGKKVMNPIIDGVKVTPAKYMDLISTELTFGIRKFLSDDNTEHKKFMFELFRPELEKLGVIFDKKSSEYEESILGQLDKFTAERDQLRARCQHMGAFVADFEREGYKLENIAAMQRVDALALSEKRNQLLIQKGQAEGNAKADYQKAISEVTEKGQKLVNEAREINERLMGEYDIDVKEYNKSKDLIHDVNSQHDNFIEKLEDCLFVGSDVKNDICGIVNEEKILFLDKFKDLKEPQKPSTIPIIDGALRPKNGIVYHSDYNEILTKRNELAKEYAAIKQPVVNIKEFDSKISDIDIQIKNAELNNKFCDRYDLNRQWVEACEKVDQKRNELAKMYAQVNTGVNGLRMKPFFNEDGKMDIKTVYSGAYDPDFFKNKDGEERLLVSYSSTQRPLIGILLQVARLKQKSKILPYIFLDDVPMDNRSRDLITRIAEENNLTIITSITGDFDKDKLTENELLIEGGEVFFNA